MASGSSVTGPSMRSLASSPSRAALSVTSRFPLELGSGSMVSSRRSTSGRRIPPISGSNPTPPVCTERQM